jgi:molybdopterin converting factor small subunit
VPIRGMVKAMKIIINVFGPEISVKKEIFIEPESSMMKDVLRALHDRSGEGWHQILKDDLSLEKDCVILVNGRNIGSLNGMDTPIQEGDEITLTVLMAGG